MDKLYIASEPVDPKSLPGYVGPVVKDPNETKIKSKQNHPGFPFTLSKVFCSPKKNTWRLTLSFLKTRCLWRQNLVIGLLDKENEEALIKSMEAIGGDMGDWQLVPNVENFKYFGTLVGRELVKDFHFDYAQVNLEFWVGEQECASVLFAQHNGKVIPGFSNLKDGCWVNFVLSSNVIMKCTEKCIPGLVGEMKKIMDERVFSENLKIIKY